MKQKLFRKYLTCLENKAHLAIHSLELNDNNCFTNIIFHLGNAWESKARYNVFIEHISELYVHICYLFKTTKSILSHEYAFVKGKTQFKGDIQNIVST